MNKYTLTLLSILVVSQSSVHTQDRHKLLHDLANKKALTKEEEEQLDELLADPQIDVNKPRDCCTPLCSAMYQENKSAIVKLAAHPKIDLTLPSTTVWGYAQLLPCPLEVAAKDPNICNILEQVPLEKLIQAAESIPPRQRSKELNIKIDCWRLKLAILFCLRALDKNIPSQKLQALKELIHPPEQPLEC